MRRPQALLAAGFLFASALACAAEIDVTNHATFEQQRAVIETELRTGDRYVEIGMEERSRVTELLGGIGRILEPGTVVDALSPANKVEVFNSQEEINQILTRAAKNSQQVCKRERRTGSNFTVSACQTVAQRQRLRDQARDSTRTTRPQGQLFKDN